MWTPSWLNYNTYMLLFVLGLVHTYPFLFEKGHFFPSVWPTVHTYSVKTVTVFFLLLKTLSRVKIFENPGHSFTCGRTMTEVFEYEDVIHQFTTSITHALQGMPSYFHCQPFSYGWTKTSNTLCIDAYSF